MRYFIFLILIMGSLFAHKLNLFYVDENNKIYFSTYFASGAPCKNCEVDIYDENKKVIKRLKTDDKGEFIVEYFKGMSIKVETIGGHAVEEKIIVENYNTKQNAQEIIENKNKEVKKNSIIETILAILAIGFIFYILKRLKVGRV